VAPRVGPFAASPWAPSRPSACNPGSEDSSQPLQPFRNFEKLNAVRRSEAAAGSEDSSQPLQPFRSFEKLNAVRRSEAAAGSEDSSQPLQPFHYLKS
jgi:hypothetical protein